MSKRFNEEASPFCLVSGCSRPVATRGCVLLRNCEFHVQKGIDTKTRARAKRSQRLAFLEDFYAKHEFCQPAQCVCIRRPPPLYAVNYQDHPMDEVSDTTDSEEDN